MRNWNSVILAGLLTAGAVWLAGCERQDHDHKHGSGPEVTVADDYGKAIEQIEEFSAQIEKDIAAGMLDKVHHPADQIRKIAEKLPGLAKGKVDAGDLKSINKHAKELVDMFDEIDKVADAGKKAETVKLHEKMKELIKELAGHAKHGDEEHHDK